MRKLFCILISLVTVFSLASAAYAGSITVNGTGEAMIPADTAVISLGVNARNADVRKAQEDVNNAIAQIREALIEAGIDEGDINTGYLNIYAIYDYSSSIEELTAYNVNSSLAIRITDMEKAGEIIDLAFASGANTLDGITFSASDTSEAEEKALRAATEDARIKADILADAAGLEIAGIDSINEGGTYSFDNGLRNNFALTEEAAAGDAGTYIQAAKLTVSANITITYVTTD